MDHDERGDRIVDETNRERLLNVITDEINLETAIGTEIEYVMDVWRDDEECGNHDTIDAFEHVMSVAEHNQNRAIVSKCVDILIRLGYYKPRTGEVVIMGRDRSPTRGGVRFDAEGGFWDWVEK